MRKLQLLLDLWLALLLCAPAWGQLDVKSSYTLGEPIIVRMVVPEKPAEAVLRKDKFKIPGATAVKVDDTTWHVWAVPGKYAIEASGEWRLYQTIVSKDDKEYKVIADEDDYEFAASFEVTGGGDNVVPPPIPVPGTKWGLVLRETNNGQSPQLGNLLIQLREKFPGRQLVIHDPTSLPPSLKSLIPSVTPPVLTVLARQADGTDRVVKTVPLTDSSTVADVEKELK